MTAGTTFILISGAGGQAWIWHRLPPPPSRPFEDPWPLAGWPDVPTKVLASTSDRFFPVAFQRRLARERLGLVPDELPGGHLVALSRPAELADRLVSYLREPSGSQKDPQPDH